MAKNGFFVQLHVHTSETSACGRSSGAEMARAAKEAGLDMLVITDHFMNANIGCPRDWPWADKVEYLLRGYRAAKEEGDRIGLKVLFGWETVTQGPEFLTYGLGEDFLLANPDIAKVDKPTYLRRVKEAGGFVIHAHPFREAPYIVPFDPDPLSVEAFEVFNAAHRVPAYNEKALKMAREYNLIECAGSDAHVTENLCGGVMKFPHALETSADLIAAIRNREGEIVEHFEGK